MPTGWLIGQPILHHQPHGQGNDAMSVVGLGQSLVGHVRSKTFTALGAVMLRVNEMDVRGPASNQISNLVQNPGDGIVPPTTMVTTWTGVMLVVPATQNNLGLSQILRFGNAFRGIR